MADVTETKKSLKDIPFDPKTPDTYRRLLHLLGRHKGRLILAVLLVAVAVLGQALAPYFTGLTINSLGDILTKKGGDDASTTFLINISLVLGAYGLYVVLSYVSNLLIISASQDAIFDLREQIDQKIGRLPLNYYDTTTYGDILARLTNDVEVVSQAFQQSIFEILKGTFSMIFMFIVMITLSPWLTIVGLLSIPPLFILANKITSFSQRYFNTQMKKAGELNGYVEEYYTGHNVVTLFGKEREVHERFSEINDEVYESSRRGQFLSGTLYPFTRGASKVGYALVCFVGAILAIMGGLSIGMIQAFTQYLSQFSERINTMMGLTSILQQTGAAGQRIFEFLDEEEEVPEAAEPLFPEKLEGNVEFDHVRFGYLPHQTLISDLNVDVNAGEKVAIVGPTGAGKTTLINLIMRFYDVKGGAIRIDGVDIRDMKREDLRNIFGMVLQETWLYSGSIMDNIRYGKLDATDEEVIAAAKAACADAFIDTLPGGYHFILTEGASNIAQGQRQLLTIARAMLNDPPIMILDEATSSVDTRTEVLIQEAMQNMMAGRTSFVIAHRLSTIKDAQKILYMQDGDILEIGTHDELMAKDGLYAKLYNSQFAD